MAQGFLQNTEVADMAQLQATMRAIELACNSIQVVQSINQRFQNPYLLH